MNHAQEPGKRIVSKGRYVWMRTQLGARLVLFVFAVMLMALTGVSAVVLLLCLPFVILGSLASSHISVLFLALTLLLVLPLVTFYAYKLGDKLLSAAEDMPSIAPLTRANTADLPALQSLVRASEEPLQAQKTVLLRAATDTTQPLPEQLVRAAGGME